jgi:hypothetical protein
MRYQAQALLRSSFRMRPRIDRSMFFSLEPATVPPPSLEARLISALRIVSDGAELEGQKLALNLKLTVPRFGLCVAWCLFGFA